MPIQKFQPSNPFDVFIFAFSGWGNFDRNLPSLSKYLQSISLIYLEKNDCVHKFPGSFENLICTAELPNKQGSAEVKIIFKNIFHIFLIYSHYKIG